MLVHLEGRFAYLALTKSGSTSVENALRPRCQILFTRDHRVTHMPAHQFDRLVRPCLDAMGLPPVDSVCQLRHPVSWLESWWRYRSKPPPEEAHLATGGIGFERFAQEYMDGADRPYLGMHRPMGFLTETGGTDGKVIVDLVFRYEDMELFAAFVERRTRRPIRLGRDNRSPFRWARLSRPVRARLEDFFAPELAVWESGVEQSADARGRSAD